MKVGFTGTKEGMTDSQKWVFRDMMSKIKISEFHHGDCIGADSEAHGIVLGFLNLASIYAHLPLDDSRRAFCKSCTKLEPKPYLQRNHDIVDSTDLLIACPKEFYEELRSGTWATIRYARKQKKKVWIIYPNGSVEK